MKQFLLAIGFGLVCMNVSAQQVLASDHQSFWLWGNFNAQHQLRHAKTLYILQGEIDRKGITPQGLGILPKSNTAQIWLVYRVKDLHWSANTLPAILKRLQQWQNAGHSVLGLQIDYDSPTADLANYADFLTQLRQQLPRRYQLSITGLMDWTNIQDQHTLAQLRKSIGFIAIQTYRGRSTINNVDLYLKKIARLKLPYKIGLVEHGDWHAPDFLNKDPYFQGYVIFLLK